jgi:antitoxin YqcF
MDNQPSDRHKVWALHLRQLVGGEVSVNVYYDEAEEQCIPVFTSASDEGILCATIGLMEIDQSQNPEIQINSEIILDKRVPDKRVPNVLSTIAFQIINGGWKVAPGVVFRDIMRMYFPEINLPHIYFTAPFQWSTMAKVDLPGGAIYPLVAIPVSEEEVRVAGASGDRILEEGWTQQQVDVFNWDRQGAA